MTDWIEHVRRLQVGTLPELLGFEWTRIETGVVEGRLEVRPHHLAPNGFLHAASVVAFADTACGYGCVASLPEGATSFTTSNLRSDFVGTAREGVITVAARMVHGGRTTQLWDAEVRVEGGEKPIALFRCTQIVLYPR